MRIKLPGMPGRPLAAFVLLKANAMKWSCSLGLKSSLSSRGPEPMIKGKSYYTKIVNGSAAPPLVKYVVA